MDAFVRLVALRREFIDQLEGLPESDWDAPTLCAGWRVRHVVAHTTMPKRIVTAGLLAGLVRSRFDLGAMLFDDAVRRGDRPVPEVVARFRDAIESRTVPPRRNAQHLLDDLLVHVQDIRRPLGLPWAYDGGLLTSVASALTADRALGVPGRIAGLRLHATDLAWGAGAPEAPEVAGPAEALIMVMAGRPVALADLAGPGVPTLAARIGQ